MSKKVVLEEEEYVERLGLIIERDFFPDLRQLQNQTKPLRAEDGLQWTETTSGLTPTGQSYVLARRNASETAWDESTPTSELAAGNQTQGEDEYDTAKATMTLNRFVATHTSEDNDSFKELQEKAVRDHQRRFHWAFDDDEEKGDPKFHLLKSGTWISKEQRKIADEACALKGPKDDRPSAPDTWKFRARNPLLFTPELAASRDICQIKADSGRQLLLKNDPNLRPRLLARSQPKTVYANSRFSSNDTQLIGSECGETSVCSREDYALVPMTPLIAPGVAASPLMTWGDIEGTPTILDTGATPGRIQNTLSFEVQDTSRREKLATRLEQEARHRNPKLRLSGKKTSSKSQFKAEQKHNSQSIRARMSSVRSVLRTPVGSDPQLRASYSTPLQLPRPLPKTRKTIGQ